MNTQLANSARIKLFDGIERLGTLLNSSNERGAAYLGPEIITENQSTKYIWVYVSTIGELNAIQYFLREYLAGLVGSRLVLLTDHPKYHSAFLQVFPDALVIDHGTNGEIVEFAKRFRPSILIIAEIPCMLSEAPCRLAHRVLHTMKKMETPCFVVNGWLYGEKPSCRMDNIEHWLLNKSYIDAIERYSVQTAEVADQLILWGVPPYKVLVTGNIKFDALDFGIHLPLPEKNLQCLIDDLEQGPREIITAGCVTNYSEQGFLLEAYKRVRANNTNTLLILTPRHPENTVKMTELHALLEEIGLTNELRSEHLAGSPIQSDVLILDSFGELTHMYRLSSVCYVGLNHNILEPLALGRPVIVSSGWEPTYPSYPVYLETMKAGLITEVKDVESLAEQLLGAILNRTESGSSAERQLQNLRTLQGATKRNIELVQQLVPQP